MTRPAALVLLLIALSFQLFVSNVHASEAAGRSDKEEVHNRAKQKILRIKEALEAGEVHALKKDITHTQAALRARLEQCYPGATVRLRETGRLIRAEVHGHAGPQEPVDIDGLWPGEPDQSWRLAQISFAPPTRRHD